MSIDNFDTLINELFKLKNKVLTLQEITNIYLSDVKIKCRPDTLHYYKKQLTTIIDYLYNNGVISSGDINSHIINKFIENERKKGNKNITINKSIGTLKQALKFCFKHGYISRNNLDFWESLPKEQTETQTIDTEIIKNVFQYLDSQKRTIINLRNKAMIFVFLSTGIRRNELINLKLSNIDLEKNIIKLEYTKTKKNRTVFLDDMTKKALADYFDRCKIIDYVFCDVFNKGKILPNYINILMAKIKRALNIPPEISLSPHKWRHTYATLCLENGASLEFVRKTLGHSSLSTTQKYLHLNTSKLAEEHNKVNPFNSLNLKDKKLYIPTTKN